MKPKAVVLVGHGINCDREFEEAFRLAGADASRAHINDLIADPTPIKDCQIIALAGGFSFGDDTFSGNIYAKMIKYSRLKEEFAKHLMKGNLLLGVCNGNQIGTVLNLIPVFEDYFAPPETAFTYNDSARYEDRGNIHMSVFSQQSHWLKGLGMLRNIPIGHGEGKFYAPPEVLQALYKQGLVALKYAHEDGRPANGEYPINPNGSVDDIAGLASDHVLLMMPHPERAIKSYNQDGWTRRKSLMRRSGQQMPEEGEGMKIIMNGVEYFTRM